jgi:hypothetical protein
MTLLLLTQAIVARHPGARISLPRLTELGDIPAEPEITLARERLHDVNGLGEQYDWLARYAVANGLNDLELCVHRDDKAHAVIAGVAEPVVDGADSYHVVPEGPGDAARIFSRFRFPVLEMTKVEMEEHARRDGFLDIMDRTWFCHTPTRDGHPCGVCNPCIYTVAEGLGRRLPSSSLRRNRNRKRLAARAWRWVGSRLDHVGARLGLA